MRPRERSHPFDEELAAYIDSKPPPPLLLSAKERINARIDARERLDTPALGFILEDVQAQLRKSLERESEEKVREARERADAAEKRLEKSSDRRWDLVLLLLTAVASALAGHFLK